MTIASQLNRIAYTGNDVAVDFAVSFPFQSQEDLAVVETIIATGVQTTKELTTDYTISGTVDDLGYYSNGGTVTAVTAPASTVTWTIYRAPARLQSLSLSENNALPAESLEAQLDYQTMLLQRVHELANRSLHQPEGDNTTIDYLPAKIDRLSKYLAFDSNGDPIAVDAATASGTSVLATGSTTTRLLADRFADFVNVMDYGATGDGVSNDTTAVQAAVTAAHTAEGYVYWPVGTYLTTASIANLHDVRHRGPGIVKRGSTLFYPDPSMNPGVTNNLYVATTGSNTNDGLTSSEPRLTVQSMGDVIYNYQYSNAVWRVNIAAGTYTSGTTTFNKAFPSPQRVEFTGATVSRGVQPTTIIEASGYGLGSSVNGIYFQNSVRAKVSHINFKKFRTDAAVDSNNLSSGIIVDARSEVWGDNVWTDECDIGFYVANNSQCRIQAGRHGYNAATGCGALFIRHSNGAVGYGGSAADVTGATGVAVIGGQYGVRLHEFSMIHADYCYFKDQTQSGALVTLSRIHSVSSTYDGCYNGIDGRSNAQIGETTNTFTGITFTNVVLRSGSQHVGSQFDDSTMLSAPLRDITAVGHSTSSATYETAYTRTLKAYEIQERGRGFKLRIYGESIGVTDTKTVRVSLGATVLLTATIAASTADYEIQVDLIQVTAASSQKIFTRVLQSGVLPVLSLNVSIAVNTTVDNDIVVEHKVTNVADSNRIGFIELDVTR